MRLIFLALLICMTSFACHNQSEKSINRASSILDNGIVNQSNPILPKVSNCGYQLEKETQAQGWSMIFEDDFDTDFSKQWNAWNSGAYNDELQYYQEQNVKVENGFLHLIAKRESAKGQSKPNDKKIKKFDFTSGRIESKQLFGPKNIEGQETIKFSARLKTVDGEGMWPAWWSYGHPWPTRGEIDILEARGNRPHEFSSCLHYGEVDGIPDTKVKNNVFDFLHEENLTDCFHVYDMEWSQNSIKIYFDEELVKTYNKENFKYINDFWEQEHLLCLNLAVGGNFFKKKVDEEKIPDEAFYVVDWVRVFSR